MPKLRYHRGTLCEALNTEVLIRDKDDFFFQLNEHMLSEVPLKKISIDYQGIDGRLGGVLRKGLHSYLVAIEGWGVIGHLTHWEKIDWVDKHECSSDFQTEPK